MLQSIFTEFFYNFTLKASVKNPIRAESEVNGLG